MLKNYSYINGDVFGYKKRVKYSLKKVKQKGNLLSHIIRVVSGLINS